MALASGAVMTTGIQVALTSLREPLQRVGFQKRAGWIFTTDLAGGVLGWLGLNHANRHRRPGETEVNPVVGVRNQRVERWVAELRGLKFRSYVPATISIPIGYLMPEHRYVAWVFSSHSTLQKAEEVVAAVADYGLPFMRPLIELPSLLNMAERGLAIEADYRMPVILAMLGRTEDARDTVIDTLDNLRGRDDDASIELRHFGERFMRSDLASG